jgi:hypothetical protein
MDPSPLVREQIDAGARFLVEFQKYMPLQAAFWLKDSDEREWFLYLASDQITDDNFDVVYGEVVRIGVTIHDPAFDMFRVKVIGADHRLAKAAFDLQGKYPGKYPIHVVNRMFGGVSAEEVYIYPSPILVPAP